MNIFQLKPSPHGSHLMKEFLKDNFVCMGWPGIGDLDNVSKDELKKRLAHVYDSEGQELAGQLDEASTFLHEMQDGDYVLVADEEWVHIGDMGDYFYIEHSDTAEDGTCHRRGVTWMKSVLLEELNEELQGFLSDRSRGNITKYERSFENHAFESWMSKAAEPVLPTGKPTLVDEQTISQAIEVLRIAMQSDDADRRERAAMAILQYAKQ
ncbi:putative Mrr-cat superfamily restriction endonuclease [Paenibacillus castaneae]|uniref:hypothetical protein n=1 Tax=Paenibacillus castaneae TaxID=474957 RepID=UPI000C9AF144|nr:hypothetical protein [Paenibacillus castaneae]NIK78282.1 putative Mrr-cat superfamily restriction endonuclease [Paenibacillus castaneae]